MRAGVALASGWPEYGSVCGCTSAPMRAAELFSADQWIGTNSVPRCCPSVDQRRARRPRRAASRRAPARPARAPCARHRRGGSPRTARRCARRGAGESPVRVMVCHWSRTRPVLSTNGHAFETAAQQARLGDRPRSAPCRPAVKKPPSANRRCRRSLRPRDSGHWNGVERVERLVARGLRRPEMSKARLPPFSKPDSARVLVEDVGGASDRRRPRRSPGAAPPGSASTSRAAPRPASGRNARWREMHRSELVTVPSFSPHAAAGRRTCARAHGVVGRDVLGDDQQLELGQRRAHRIGARQRHGRVGAHDPQRLDARRRRSRRTCRRP